MRTRTAVVHLGGIDYLNSLPLLWGLDDREDDLELTYHVPSRLATMLDQGELDAALIPIVAYADRPGYAVVPGLSIASYGGVRSIRLYYRGSLESTRRVGLDTCSRTSALLTRLLFRDVWEGAPEFVQASPSDLHAVLSGEENPESAAAGVDAALLIGDAALSCGIYEGWENVDLGTEWTRWTGLPFVYAFWACRPERLDHDAAAQLVARLEHARQEGVKHIDRIVREAKLPDGFAESDAIHYLHHVIQYDLGPDKLEAMRLFFDKLRTAGLLEFGLDGLRFLGE